MVTISQHEAIITHTHIHHTHTHIYIYIYIYITHNSTLLEYCHINIFDDFYVDFEKSLYIIG